MGGDGVVQGGGGEARVGGVNLDGVRLAEVLGVMQVFVFVIHNLMHTQDTQDTRALSLSSIFIIMIL